MTARLPAAAQTAERALAAFPVEAATSVSSRSRLASATMRKDARSLSEPLGSSPSFLIQTFSSPKAFPSDSARKKGVVGMP